MQCIYIYIYICFPVHPPPVPPKSFYYRLTNHICQMEESSYSFSTMGILQLLRWLCSAAPQPLCLYVLHSLPHISSSAFLLTLSNIQGHFDTGIVNYISAWKILKSSQRISIFKWSVCSHWFIPWVCTIYVCVSAPPLQHYAPLYAPSALIIDF